MSTPTAPSPPPVTRSVPVLEQKPSIRPCPHEAGQCECPGKPSPEELKSDPVVTPTARQIGTVIPDRDPSSTVLAPRDLAFEVTEAQIVVLNGDSQTTHACCLGDRLAKNPTLEDPIPLESKIEMVGPGKMLLNDIAWPSRHDHGSARKSSREVTRGTSLPDGPAAILTTCLDCSGP